MCVVKRHHDQTRIGDFCHVPMYNIIRRRRRDGRLKWANLAWKNNIYGRAAVRYNTVGRYIYTCVFAAATATHVRLTCVSIRI